jgi:hypothetical protein
MSRRGARWYETTVRRLRKRIGGLGVAAEAPTWVGFYFDPKLPDTNESCSNRVLTRDSEGHVLLVRITDLIPGTVFAVFAVFADYLFTKGYTHA